MTSSFFKYLAGISAACLISACGPTPATDTAVTGATHAAALSLMAPWENDQAPGVAVAVSYKGKTVFANAGGMANLEHNIALTPDSVLQVASVSKQFTAFATLLLVDEGKIDLHGNIRDYLPEMYETPVPITIADLLNHMGGLREHNTLSAMAGWLDDDIRTPGQVHRLNTRQRGINFPAGSEVEYSNTGYILLARIVEQVSGQSFRDFTQEKIFTPLGMTQTQFKDRRNALIPERADSYYPDENGFMNIVSADELYGSSGLYTTATDLLKWAENFDTHRVGNDRVFTLMAQRAQAENGEDSTFAKGQERRIFKGLETWSHGGRDAGFRSFLLRVPDENFSVAILSNRTDFDTAKMAFGLLDIYLSSSKDYTVETASPPTPLKPETMQAFSGHYQLHPGVIFTVQSDKDGLKTGGFGANLTDSKALPYIASRQFLLNPEADISVTFDAPVNGRSPGLGYNIGLHGTLRAERIELEPFDPSSVTLSDYVGTYESAELSTTYTLTIQNGELRAEHYRRPSFSFSPFQTDRFLGNGPLQDVTFERDDNDQIIGMRASAPLVRGIRFKRSNPS